MRRTRSWSGFKAQPQRYIIHRNDGLIQVMRARLNGATNVPARSAGSAIFRGYAWYTVIVESVYAARTRRPRPISLTDLPPRKPR